MNSNRIYRISFLFILGALFFLSSCSKQECTVDQVVTMYKNVTIPFSELRQDIKVESPKTIENTGKIYFYADHLFLNEPNEGIHVIDITFPEAPINKSFIPIPGNIDMAVRNGILYANNYLDLVSINIKNTSSIEYMGRAENVFAHQFYVDPVSDVFHAQIPYDTVVTYACGGRGLDFANNRGFELSADASIVGSTGVGGSMARFTIAKGNLYVVDDHNLQTFNLDDPIVPALGNSLGLGWGIETIFPYGDNLFIGANNGMHIVSIQNEDVPEYLSNFAHVQACDPVFVDGNIAYVTLRSEDQVIANSSNFDLFRGGWCENSVNQLDVIDITNLSNPTLLRSYDMDNPHGLSKAGDILYICEGDYGLKAFDASSWNTIDQKLIAHLKGIPTYDIITLPIKNLAIVVGDDGLYNFDISDPNKIRELSVIRVNSKG